MAENKEKKIDSPRLQKDYKDKYAKELAKELNLATIMQAPRIEKIVVNVGAGRALQNPKFVDTVCEELSAITGQAPVKTKAKKAIAGFKLRENVVIGSKVTLRSKKMYEFLDRLVNVALPRVRDFNGLSRKSFDKNGNYTIGIKEQIIFPEINFDKVEQVHGMDITLVIKSRGKEDSIKLLEKFNFPLKKN
ncbi:MAG: 50S ribosomal protein L5 [Spirochaetia bacterium]|nr:50S ribosomal protein L5 [Spirochaetia bacterium]